VAGCSWTAVSNVGWITITTGASGSGNGTVSYSVGANGGAARSGTMTIAGQTFTVTQSGGCSYSISPTSQAFTAAAGSGSVAVTAGAGCSWTAASNAGWITITTGASGSGNGTVTYSVAANGGAARTGTMTIAGQTFTVTQNGTGGTPPSPVSVTPAYGEYSDAVFSFVYSDPIGPSNINFVMMEFRGEVGAPTCSLRYYPASNSLQLLLDSSVWSGFVNLGVTGRLENNQCYVDSGCSPVGCSSATSSGQNLTVNLALTFKPAFAGPKTTWMQAQNNAAANSGWQQKGTLQVPGAPTCQPPRNDQQQTCPAGP